MPRLATNEIELSIREFSRGILGGIAERGIARVNWLAGANNLYGRPYRAMRIRPGSRDVSIGYLVDQPHSLMAYYATGTSKVFVGSANKIHEVTETGYVLQTLTAGHPASSDYWSHVNINHVLVTTQRGGSKVPLQYDGASWKELALPAPQAGSDDVGFAADTGGGGVDDGDHYYRVRWQYDNGSTIAGPASALHTVGSGNNTVHINAGLEPATPRDDYVGWTLERTKVNGNATDGPWWFVADGTGTTYTDDNSDASLGYIADEGAHSAPPHFDGVISFTERLWGWAGSSLYASQSSDGDVEATGIANFDPDLLYQISKDDGDAIQLCLVVIDELLILKRRSVHIISGVDPESYVVTNVVYSDPSRGSEAGCLGPRAGCVVGGKAYFWSDSGGLFSYQRGRGVQPEAWIEMGRYLDDLNTAAQDKIIMVNHEGNFMLAWYPSSADTIASDQIVYDARFKQWWHWSGWSAADVIELKPGPLGGASLVFAGSKDLGQYDAIPDGATIQDDFVVIGGALIPVTAAIAEGTAVVGAVSPGDTVLTMSEPAIASVTDGSFIIGGVRYHRLSAVQGSVLLSIAPHYRCWSAFDGFGDEKDITGQNGKNVEVSWESPWMDGGLPDDWKDLERVSFSSESDELTIAISIMTDPDGAGTALLLSTDTIGDNWDEFNWDEGDWSGEAPGVVASGVPLGTIGRRFKFKLDADCAGDHRPTSLEVIGTLLPDKELTT